MKNTRIYEALLARCKADRIEALATLDVYMSNPVGRGGHPQIVEEAMNQLDKLATAEGKIVELKAQYGYDDTKVKQKVENDSEIQKLSKKIDNFIKQLTEGK